MSLSGEKLCENIFFEKNDNSILKIELFFFSLSLSLKLEAIFGVKILSNFVEFCRILSNFVEFCRILSNFVEFCRKIN